MPAAQLKNKFNSGEWSPLLDGRSDLDFYESACSLLRNNIVLPYGGAYRRPGSAYLATAKGQARLIEFIFSNKDAFVLEIGNLYIRTYKVEASVGVFTAEIVTPWSAADLNEIQYHQINDVMYFSHPDIHPQVLSRLSDTSWTVASLYSLADIRDGVAYPPFQDQNVTATTVAPKSGTFPDWVAGNVYAVGDKIDRDGVLYIARKAHTANTDKPTDEEDWQFDLAASNWRQLGGTEAGGGLLGIEGGGVIGEEGGGGIGLETDSGDYDQVTLVSAKGNVWDDGNDALLIPAGAFMQISNKRPSTHVELAINANATSDILTGVLGGYNFRTYGNWSADIAVERSYDSAQTWETIRTFVARNLRNIDIADEETKANAWYRFTISNLGTTSPAGVYPPRAILELKDSYVSGVVRVDTVTSQTEAIVTVVDLLYGSTATDRWRAGSWNSNAGYPQAVTSHELRIFYGGSQSQPLTTWGSRQNDFQWNRPGGTQDDDAVQYSLLGGGQQNRIQWMVSRQQLVIGTEAAEWTLGSNRDEDSITPLNVKARRHSTEGSAHVQAVLVGEAVLYVQRHGIKLREFAYSFEEDNHVSTDLTRLADPTRNTTILDVSYQSQREKILWCVLGDGNIASLTYDRREQVVGWAIHETEGTIESLCVVPSSSEHDEVWMIVNRSAGRFIERLDPDTWKYEKTDAKLKDYVYLDAAKAATISPAGTVATGFTHLAGREVSLLVDGSTHAKKTVSATGTITLDREASKVLAGYAYDSRVRPMRLAVDTRSGTSRGRKRRIHELQINFYQTLGGKVAAVPFQAEPTAFDDIPFRETGDLMGSAPPLYTGELEVRLESGWGEDGLYEIKQSDPFPFTVLYVVAKFDVLGD